MCSKGTRLAESERGVWFPWKRYGICTPHSNRKCELILFRGRSVVCSTTWEPSAQKGVVLQTSANDTRVCTEYIGYQPRPSEQALLASAKVTRRSFVRSFGTPNGFLCVTSRTTEPTIGTPF